MPDSPDMPAAIRPIILSIATGIPSFPTKLHTTQIYGYARAAYSGTSQVPDLGPIEDLINLCFKTKSTDVLKSFFDKMKTTFDADDNSQKTKYANQYLLPLAPALQVFRSAASQLRPSQDVLAPFDAMMRVMFNNSALLSQIAVAQVPNLVQMILQPEGIVLLKQR